MLPLCYAALIIKKFIILTLYFRLVLTGGGAPRARFVSRLQQAHPAGAKHDAEGRSGLRSGFHSAHQCGKLLNLN